MPALIDADVLVHRVDPRFPVKQAIPTRIVCEGIEADTVRVPHQAIVEFVAAVTRPIAHGPSLLTATHARREAEEMLAQFRVLYPDEAVVRLALRGAAAYQLSWFDAHLWAYAEHFGLDVLYSEDFQHDRLYGGVRVMNPFA